MGQPRRNISENDPEKSQLIGISKHKLNAYLITEFNRTEKFTAGSPATVWEPPFDPNNLCAFDDYMNYLNISYWWKMTGNYVVSGDNEPNVGTAGVMPLTSQGTIGVNSNQPSLVPRACDGKSIYKGYWGSYHHAGVLVDGSQNFTMGGWFTIGATLDNDGSRGIFMTNRGTTVRSGIHVRPVATTLLNPAYLLVSPSRFSSGINKSYSSPAGSIIVNKAHFIVLRVIPSFHTSSLQFDLFIDGVKQVMTSDANPDHAIGWNITDSNRPAGIYYSGEDGQSNGSSIGGYDELFFHWGLLTDHQILEIYTRGAT